MRRTYPNKIFRRFFGLFWPIFDSNLGVNIGISILTPKFESKIGSKEPENRQKLFIRIGSIHRKLSFTLIEVMVAICLLILATSAIGWKMHEMIAKKRFTANMERLRSRLLTCRQLSLNMQSDWEGILECKGKMWTFDAYCIDNPKVSKLPPLSFDSLEVILDGEKRSILSFDFTASGDVFPQGHLEIRGGEKVGRIEWKFPDLFSLCEGNKLGPSHPDDLKNLSNRIL